MKQNAQTYGVVTEACAHEYKSTGVLPKLCTRIRPNCTYPLCIKAFTNPRYTTSVMHKRYLHVNYHMRTKTVFSRRRISIRVSLKIQFSNGAGLELTAPWQIRSDWSIECNCSSAQEFASGGSGKISFQGTHKNVPAIFLPN